MGFSSSVPCPDFVLVRVAGVLSRCGLGLPTWHLPPSRGWRFPAISFPAVPLIIVRSRLLERIWRSRSPELMSIPHDVWGHVETRVCSPDRQASGARKWESKVTTNGAWQGGHIQIIRISFIHVDLDIHQWDVAKGGKGHIQIIMVMINLTHADGNIMFIHAKLIAHRIKKIIQCKKYARISWWDLWHET
jgi:hypothetical protein